MKIGIIATRLAGTDGVSLETEKWVKVLLRMGHEVFFTAGELSGFAANGSLLPIMHFNHAEILKIQGLLFTHQNTTNRDYVAELIIHFSKEIKSHLRSFINKNKIDLIIIENALAIPMNIPLGIAINQLVTETRIPAIAHHHDFFWERERFSGCLIPEILEENFPLDLPEFSHVTINSIARESLRNRKGIESVVIPNVYDFANPPAKLDYYGADLRHAIGFDKKEPLILQPTRVIRRKGIEFAIELVHQLGLENPRLVISHAVGDEGIDYWNELTKIAERLSVTLQLIDFCIDDQRHTENGNRFYSLADVYLNADMVTYPSIYEGFGNALLEAVYFKRPLLINRYPVYNSDIRKQGFKFIEIDNKITPFVVESVSKFLKSPVDWEENAELNFAIAKEHYSLERLEQLLRELIK